MGRDDAKGRDADGQHFGRCVVELQQRARNSLEQDETDEHDADGIHGGILDGLKDTVLVPRAVVVGDDGDHAVVDAEDGHEDEALELEIRAEDGGRSGCERHQDAVETEDHDGTDGRHDDGRQTDGIDAPDDFRFQFHVLETQGDLLVVLHVEEQRESGGDDLTEDGRDGRALDTHSRCAEKAEDEDGVGDTVDDGAGGLGDHAVEGLAGGKQHPLEADLHQHTKGKDEDGLHVVDAVLSDLRGGVLCFKERFGHGERHDEEQKVRESVERDRVVRGPVCHFEVPLAQALGDQG